MNRCDFSSISTCLKNHISESNQMSQPDFLYELFEDFMDDPANQDFSMDNGLVCRWMTGQAKISPKISAYYSKPSNQEKLAHTIHQNLLPLMSDCNMAIQDIYTLFIQDDSISDAKKKNLTPLYKPASSRLLFLAKLISFGMERQFIKRNTKNQKLLAGGALSPIVLDYIMDSEVHAVILSEEIKNWKNYIPCLRKTVMFFFAESPESEKVNLPKPTQSGT